MPLTVEIWSDVVCPWCYIGKRRFETALQGFEHADEVTVMWRSFELDPEAPKVVEGPYADRLAAQYGMTVERATQLGLEMTERAAAEGLEFHLGRSRSGNTFDAHRLIHLAATSGHQAAAKERLLKAYFTEGRSLFDDESLTALAVEAGLEPGDVRAVLAGDDYAAAVAADIREAQALGANGVPFFVFDRRFGVSGAQPVDVFSQVLARARENRVASNRYSERDHFIPFRPAALDRADHCRSRIGVHPRAGAGACRKGGQSRARLVGGEERPIGLAGRIAAPPDG
jgi:predicted DsbA family dithiol-disulfide isomerase